MAIPAIAAGVSTAYNAIPASAKAKTLQWIKQATNGAVTDIKSAIGYAQKSPATAAVVAEGFVRSGAPAEQVADWFQSGPHAAEIRQSLIRLGQSLVATADAARPGVSGNTNDTSADVLRLQLCKSLVRAFGSVENARRIQLALATLKSADFEWYEAMQTNLGR